MSGVNVNPIQGFEYSLVDPKNGITIRSKLDWETYKALKLFMIVLSKKKNIVDLLRNNIVYFSRMF
jgi:hypothetical protein